MLAYETATLQHPWNRSERIWNELVVLEVYTSKLDLVTLAAIQSLEPGRGHASAALKFICDLAARHKLKVALSPNKFRRKGLCTTALRAWYGRHGFKRVPGCSWMVKEAV